MAEAARDLRLHGPITATRVNLTPLSRRLIIDRLLRRVAAPTLMDLVAAGTELHTAPDTLIERLIGTATSRLAELRDEFHGLWRELQTRYELQPARLGYPAGWALEENSCLVLYAIVRLARPSIILETGVANGQSTFFMLRGLQQNGAGKLISVDVRSDVGGLLRDDERTHWDLRVLRRAKLRNAFRQLVAELPRIDLYLHDSEHTYSWQTYEYSVVTDKLSEDGIVMSDDVDGTYAFLDFCRRIDQLPLVLVDHRKVLGVALPNKLERTRHVASRP